MHKIITRIFIVCIAMGAFGSLLAEIEASKQTPPPTNSSYTSNRLLQEAEELKSHKKYDAAASRYEELVSRNPTNVDYLYQLGEMNVHLNQKQEAIKLFKQALQIQPDNQDVLAALAFAYLSDNPKDSKDLFQRVLKQNPNNIEALAGAGYIEEINENFPKAEEYFQKALKIDPQDYTTLIYLGTLRMQQQRYPEATDIFEKLQARYPDDADVQLELQKLQSIKTKKEQTPTPENKIETKKEQTPESENKVKNKKEKQPSEEDQNLIKQVHHYQENGNYSEAESLCYQLIENTPNNPDYYLMLGGIYIKVKQYNAGIGNYYLGLQIAPENADLLQALGFAYLFKAQSEDARECEILCYTTPTLGENTNLAMSRLFLQRAIIKNPKNADVLAGLGRIAAIESFYEEAEAFYNQALSIDPKNELALSYLASLKYKEKEYFGAEYLYQSLLAIDPSDDDARSSLSNVLIRTRPAITVRGYYEEENEKDMINLVKEDWVVRLKNYGIHVLGTSPLGCSTFISGRIGEDYIELDNLISKTKIYSLDIKRAGVGLVWNYNPYLTVYGGSGVSYATQYHHSTFKTNDKWLVEPFLGVSYNKSHSTVVIETVSDSALVARNFTTFRSKLIARQLVQSSYEYDFGKNRLIGAFVSNAWYYNCFVPNQRQWASAWLQLTPTCLWENISLRYQFDFGRFNRLTPDYYTFQHQTTHWLKLGLSKNWWNERIQTSAGYAHGWQRSFEQGQIITVVPTGTFHFVHREIDIVFAQAGINLRDRLNLSVFSSYYHDTFDYTACLVQGAIRFSF